MSVHLDDCEGNGFGCCWECGGSGFLDDYDYVANRDCKLCHGAGRIRCHGCATDNMGDGGPFTPDGGGK